MAQILLRDVDDALVAGLKERARQNHRSVQGEITAILEQMAPLATREEAVAIMDKWQRQWAEQGETVSDSAEIIRKMRDA